LIGLVAAERDGDPLGRGEDEIGDVERDERGAAKPSGPAEQEQRPIACAVERRRQRGERAAQLGGEERRGAQPRVSVESGALGVEMRIRVRRLLRCAAAPRLVESVLFPTLPFWFTTAS
jgi:hypothetical protein